jgi:hypothetical protein
VRFGVVQHFVCYHAWEQLLIQNVQRKYLYTSSVLLHGIRSQFSSRFHVFSCFWTLFIDVSDHLKAGQSATETLVLVQKAYGNEALNRSNVFRCYSRFRDGRELVEDDESSSRQKSTRTEVNIAAVADLLKKWLSNRIKNDSRIFEHPKVCSSSDSERGYGKEKVFCTFCSTLLDTWKDRVKSCHLQKFLNPEDVTDRLSRSVGKKLPLLSA